MTKEQIARKYNKLSFKPNLDWTEVEMREIIYYFLQFNGISVPQVITAKINDWDLFEKHVDICKNYFKCFIFDE